MAKARLQADPRCRFTIHIEHSAKGPRSYHIRATTVSEKFAWLTAINSVMPIPRQNPDLFKGRTLPLLAGWLKTQVVGGRKPLKVKDRWIQLWDTGQV